MPRALGINHVALDVGSVDEALDFWRALFPDLQLRSRSRRMAFIDLGDQFIALFEHEVEPRSEHRHFGLVVDDVAAVVAAARDRGAPVRDDNVGDPWGNRYEMVCMPRGIIVISAGEDGVFGTDDDLRSDR